MPSLLQRDDCKTTKDITEKGPNTKTHKQRDQGYTMIQEHRAYFLKNKTKQNIRMQLAVMQLVYDAYNAHCTTQGTRVPKRLDTCYLETKQVSHNDQEMPREVPILNRD